VRQYPVEEFFATTALTGGSFSPDGRTLLVSSNETGVINAYALPVDGGAPVALTRSTTDAVRAQAYFPADTRFVFTRDRGGDERTHVFVREVDGTERDVTPGDSLKADFLGFAPDGRSFFVTTNERDPRYFDLYEVAAAGYARTRLFQNDSGYAVSAVSPDRRYVALTKARTTTDADVHLHDRRTGKTTLLTPHEGSVQNAAAGFDRSGRSLFLLTDEGAEFAYLVRHDVATGRRTTVLKPEWDVTFATVSEGGRYLVAGINADARTDIRVLDAATLRPVALPTVPNATVTRVAFTRDDRRVALAASDSRSPTDFYVGEVGGGAPRRLTRSLNPRIDPAHLVDARVVRFASYDSLPVPGLLYLPHGASASNRVPAVVMVHGGPGGQARVGWNPLVQYLVNHGYAVFDINNRGSSGYGKTFFALDNRKHGEADLDDVIASKGMLVGTGVVDPARIGVMGGSYGGYMTLAALTLRPEAFAVGVDLFGPSNWVRTLESIPPWWASFREALYDEMGDPAVDSARLRRISPLFNADRIRRPLMVLQGANDPRVLQRESDEIVAAARRNNVPVEYIVFPDEGHGFVKRENQLRGYRAVLQFLDAHLKGERPATAM
jgi:dipeptidyl aminopeptidase/acylaminoacyl peptidase